MNNWWLFSRLIKLSPCAASKCHYPQILRNTNHSKAASHVSAILVSHCVVTLLYLCFMCAQLATEFNSFISQCGLFSQKLRRVCVSVSRLSVCQSLCFVFWPRWFPLWAAYLKVIYFSDGCLFICLASNAAPTLTLPALLVSLSVDIRSGFPL